MMPLTWVLPLNSVATNHLNVTVPQWPDVPWCHPVWPTFVNPVDHRSDFADHFRVDIRHNHYGAKLLHLYGIQNLFCWLGGLNDMG